MAVMWSPTFDWDTESWRDQAACRNLDPDLFFPAGTTGAALDQVQRAKAVCRACPVREACLEFAMEANQEPGIWGGLDETERRQMRRAWLQKRRPPKVRQA
jgi:WhiB family transcriptional regulator, redox-sensing transcriptional regulator